MLTSPGGQSLVGAAENPRAHRMRHRTAIAVAAFCGAALAAPASAQFGFIFGDPPPRPPTGVPGSRQPGPEPPPYPAGNPGAYPPPSGYPPVARGGSGG